MRTLLIAIVGLVVALPGVARAEVTFEWVTVGDPGNPADTEVMTCCDDSVGTTGYGSADHVYQISKQEVTNAQYAAFLNAVTAAGDPHSLYSSFMGGEFSIHGGIVWSGSTYSAIAGREDWPVNHVGFWDACRFANWLHNGQPTGAQDATTTEDGAYTLDGYVSSDGSGIVRNPDATVFVPSEDEWYKAAYYESRSQSYFAYPASSDLQTTCAVPGATPNTGNCANVVGDPTDGGSYTGSASPSGTFDQGGNVFEWNETTQGSSFRGLRGGDFNGGSIAYRASLRSGFYPNLEDFAIGFRVARVPEPQLPTLSPWSQLALMAGLLGAGLGVWRWRGTTSNAA